MRCGWQIQVAAGAGRSEGLNGIDGPLRIGYRVQASKREMVLLGAVDVAEGAVGKSRGRARGTHPGEPNLAEIIDAATESDDHKGPVGRLVHAVVNAMHQQVEVDALRRLCPVGSDLRLRADRN